MSLVRASLIAAALAVAVPALAQTPAGKNAAPAAAKEEVAIPFARFGGIDDWRADGNQALYIKGRGSSDWYYAKLMAPCQGLPFAQKIGFESEASGSFDKFSAIMVDGQKCQLVSLVKSEKPSDKTKN
jgi:hypothetical protein